MIDEIDGATPLGPDEMSGLIPDISTRFELNHFEKANISQARRWALSSRIMRKDIITVSGLIRLHKEMLKEVWSWAGIIRKTEMSIGIAPEQIQSKMKELCDNTNFQLENSVYGLEEMAIRFHHQLTHIHPFTNGNGRHARLAADLIMSFNRRKPFSWGGDELLKNSDLRKVYIRALQSADQGDICSLLEYARR